MVLEDDAYPNFICKYFTAIIETDTGVAYHLSSLFSSRKQAHQPIKLKDYPLFDIY